MSKVYIRSIINHFRRCLLCAGPAGDDALCAPCLEQASLSAGPVAGPACQQPLCRCGLPLAGGREDVAADLCGRCLGEPPPWSWLAPMAAYAGPVRPLVNRFKHQHCHAAERALQQLARHHWPARLNQLPAQALLVPVPLHWTRQWFRGFNQAARLAAFFSHHTGLAMAPVLRRRRGRPQQSASRRGRSRASPGFHCRASLSGRTVILVDDVVTTGQTARAACLALEAAGAEIAGVICLARTLPK
ncbi:MAG: ComF family protein [Alcanivoracaceae bacterium]|nr:ComF family protein [Alcanivoracaceae bacterium]